MSEIRKLIEAALAEDIGSGDVTTGAIFRKMTVASGRVVAKEGFVLAGMDVARETFGIVDESIIFRSMKKDGDRVEAGDTLAEITGHAGSLLIAERTALNFVQRLSGVATLTAAFVDKVRDSRVNIVDTRKTTPGLRALEKYAVRTGGGKNHRMGLYDGILIKDNHIAACGSIAEAVTRARAEAPHTLRVEVESGTLDEVREALAAGADIIMLDNMSLDKIREAVKIVSGRAVIEASGNITLDNVSDIASAGVNLISVGAITHSARAVDISMKVHIG